MVVWRQGFQIQRSRNLSISMQVIFLLSHHRSWCLANWEKNTSVPSFACTAVRPTIKRMLSFCGRISKRAGTVFENNYWTMLISTEKSKDLSLWSTEIVYSCSALFKLHTHNTVQQIWIYENMLQIFFLHSP